MPEEIELDLWHTERQSEGTDLRIRVEKILCEHQSPYQKIQVIETRTFGRILVVDGYIMMTEKDEFIYHEMIVHVPMSVIRDPKRALVIGGGDGGAVRELVRHRCLEKVDLVEIDGEVIEASKRFFPSVASGLGDPRVTVHIEDGIRFVAETGDTYDLIIIDSTDPFTGPGEGLFTEKFYRDCDRILNKGGILVNQHESPYYEENASVVREMHGKMKRVFPICTVYQAYIPTYPSGHWLFGFASKDVSPSGDAVPGRMEGIETGYFNEEVRAASFALPNYVKELLE
ncbi:MAG: polyamine aminopropyltransferase [Candidatus Methanomethylophilaceae archaeon]|nr:polyamine aminopropyltransferase [Candidatus Methanomethylophilaceae archaeon]